MLTARPKPTLAVSSPRGSGPPHFSHWRCVTWPLASANGERPRTTHFGWTSSWNPVGQPKSGSRT